MCPGVMLMSASLVSSVLSVVSIWLPRLRAATLRTISSQGLKSFPQLTMIQWCWCYTADKVSLSALPLHWIHPALSCFISLRCLHIRALFDCHASFCSCGGGPAHRHHHPLSAKCPAGPSSWASLLSDWKPNAIHWMDWYDHPMFLFCSFLQTLLRYILSLGWKHIVLYKLIL